MVYRLANHGRGLGRNEVSEMSTYTIKIHDGRGQLVFERQVDAGLVRLNDKRGDDHIRFCLAECHNALEDPTDDT